MKTPTQWKPVWYTIPQFVDRKPVCMYHKENISADIPEETVKNLHVLARAYLEGKNAAGSTVLRITADDYYKLYVNGRYVAQGPAPAYPEHYYYHEIDITPYLTEERNVIGLHLYYQGLVNRVWNSGDGRFGAAAQVAGKNLSWRYSVCGAYSGETTGYETQYLEDFDSSLWQEDWNLPGFDDSSWEPMVPAPWADYVLEPQPTKLMERRLFAPAKVEREPAGHAARPAAAAGAAAGAAAPAEGCPADCGGEAWNIDLGHEITGALRVRAAGPKGSRILLRFGEELSEDGRVRSAMRCNCTYEETWTLDGGECTLEPYDYKGFRYARLVPEGGARILKAEAEERHYPMDDSLCTLESSSPRLDGIFAICKNGVKYGTQEGYLDCPTREKGQYLGDAIVTANAQVWLTGTTEMLRKCILQFAETRTVCPGLMGVAPGSFMQEVADFSLLWSQLLLLDYRFTGDLGFLRSMYPVAKGILEHFSRYAREDGLLEQVADKWNLVDWPENLRDDYDFELSRPVVAPGCHNVVNALYVGAAKTLAGIERLLGLEESADWQALKASYLRAFYRPETGLLADSETSAHCALHSNLYALYFDLIPEGREKRICDFLVAKGFSCGVFASYFVLKGLARAGRYGDVFRLLVNETEHGWVNMLREGATCCYEAWGKDQKWNTSLCHPWASAPVSVLTECIAGFIPDPAASGGFLFKPHIPEELERFKLRFPFRGKVYAVVKGQDGAVQLKEEPMTNIGTAS